VIYAESKGEIKGHELSTTGRRFGLVFISIRAGWQSLHSLGLLVSLKGDTMPDSIGDNIEEEIGDNIDHIISDSVAHYLDDSMIDKSKKKKIVRRVVSLQLPPPRRKRRPGASYQAQKCKAPCFRRLRSCLYSSSVKRCQSISLKKPDTPIFRRCRRIFSFGTFPPRFVCQ
jgi:hypothetical protein